MAQLELRYDLPMLAAEFGLSDTRKRFMEEFTCIIVPTAPDRSRFRTPYIISELASSGYAVGINQGSVICIFQASLTGWTPVHRFQAIEVEPGTSYFLCVTFDGKEFSIFINEDKILRDSAEIYKIEPTFGSSETSRELPKCSFEVNPAHPFVHRLFIGSMADIKSKIEAPTEYNLIRLSGLLRHLFFHGLLDEARRPKELNFKPKFKVNKDWQPDLSGDGLIFAQISLLPLKERQEELNEKNFLRKTALWYRGKAISVRDVIDAVANAKGGAHYGNTRDEHMSVLDMDAEIARINSKSLDIIRQIAIITFHALAPLVDRIQNIYSVSYAIRWRPYSTVTYRIALYPLPT